MSRLAVIALALALAGCSKESDEPPPAAPPPELPTAEIERGLQACTDYAQKVCACAETNPALADECKLARANPTALQMTLDAAREQGAEPGDSLKLLDTGRKTIASCMESIARFRCPEPVPSEAEPE
jgi:hypothetical protein